MNDQVNPKFLSLLEHLLEHSKDCQITWRETSGENRFITSLKNGSVEVEARTYLPHEEAMDEAVVYIASLVNKDGKVAEVVTDEQADGTLLIDLFSLARSNARQSDKLLDSLLGELNHIGG